MAPEDSKGDYKGEAKGRGEQDGLVISGSLFDTAAPQAAWRRNPLSVETVDAAAAAPADLGRLDLGRVDSTSSGGGAWTGGNSGGADGIGCSPAHSASTSAGLTSAATSATESPLLQEKNPASESFHPGCGFVDGRFYISADDPRGRDAWGGEPYSKGQEASKLDRAMCGVPSAVKGSELQPHSDNPLRAVEDWWTGLVGFAKVKLGSIDLSCAPERRELTGSYDDDDGVIRRPHK